MSNKRDAFEHFRHTIEAIRREGTDAITAPHIICWNLQEVGNGTLIGTQPYPNGTVFHLSVGPYEQGTSYPTKFGAHITTPDGTKTVWFDWTVNLDERHKTPHVQFSDNPTKRYIISNDNDWNIICAKLQALGELY